jgi:hypothetical protein
MTFPNEVLVSGCVQESYGQRSKKVATKRENRKSAHLWTPYLYVVVPVVMQVEDPVYLRVAAHVQVVCILDAFTDGLSCVLLHLDVVELPETQHKQRES